MTKGIVQPAITEADVYAFRALADGKATADQQVRVGNWLFTEGCRVFSDTYAEVKESGGDKDDVLFALGRRHIGILMREMLLPSTLEKARKLDAAIHPDHRDEAPPRPSLSERRKAHPRKRQST